MRHTKFGVQSRETILMHNTERIYIFIKNAYYQRIKTKHNITFENLKEENIWKKKIGNATSTQYDTNIDIEKEQGIVLFKICYTDAA